MTINQIELIDRVFCNCKCYKVVKSKADAYQVIRGAIDKMDVEELRALIDNSCYGIEGILDAVDDGATQVVGVNEQGALFIYGNDMSEREFWKGLQTYAYNKGL